MKRKSGLVLFALAVFMMFPVFSQGSEDNVSDGETAVGLQAEYSDDAVLSVTAAGLEDMENVEPQKITGHVKIYGSMPHTAVGFVTDEGREYTIILADKDSIPRRGFFYRLFHRKNRYPSSVDEFRGLSGKRIVLEGYALSPSSGYFPALQDGYFAVYSYIVK